MVKDRLETVALFGGSFDPPHFGHKSVVQEALRTLDIERLIIVPTFLNPFKNSSEATPQQRLKWSKEVFGNISKVFISDYEINQGKPITTAQTLSHFQKKYDVKYIIIGADNLLSIQNWYDFTTLNNEITWVIATRDSYDLKTETLKNFKLLNVHANISSTEIREENKKKDKKGNR